MYYSISSLQIEGGITSILHIRSLEKFCNLAVVVELELESISE